MHFQGHILLNCAAVWIMSQTNRNGRGAIERIWFNHWITICIIRLTFKISTHTCIFNLSANNFNSSVFFKIPTRVIIKIYLVRGFNWDVLFEMSSQVAAMMFSSIISFSSSRVRNRDISSSCDLLLDAFAKFEMGHGL